MRSVKLVLAAVATAAVALPAGATARTDVHAAGTFDVPKAFAKKLPSISSKSGLDVLLPDKLGTGSTKPGRIKPETAAQNGEYYLLLGVGKHCGGATACFVAEFDGKDGADPDFTKKVTLAGGKTGYYKPLSCGASCSPPAIQWKVGTVLYGIQYNYPRPGAANAKKALISLANSANAAGAR
jgi:hypothetical protein